MKSRQAGIVKRSRRFLSQRTATMNHTLQTLRATGALLVLLAMTSSSTLLAADAPKRSVAPDSSPLPQPEGTERGVTRPIQEPKLAFAVPGIVEKVHVKEGQEVKEGDVLAEL